jgi:hypothetical protein
MRSSVLSQGTMKMVMMCRKQLQNQMIFFPRWQVSQFYGLYVNIKKLCNHLSISFWCHYFKQCFLFTWYVKKDVRVSDPPKCTRYVYSSIPAGYAVDRHTGTWITVKATAYSCTIRKLPRWSWYWSTDSYKYNETEQNTYNPSGNVLLITCIFHWRVVFIVFFK